MVGIVFLSEGIQKFLFPNSLGTGRFQNIGLPDPDLLAPLVGTFEIICGLLILSGFLTRLAALPLIVIMIVAIVTTKIELLNTKDFWEMMHASRNDWPMLLGSLFLLIKGGGYFSVDHVISNKNSG